MKPTPTPAQIEAFYKAHDEALELQPRENHQAVFAGLSAALSVPAAAVVGGPVAVPVPRGGLEPNWWEEWQKIVRKYRRLEKAARFVVSETDRIHDNEPWPLKYHAPYEAITQLRDVLDTAPSAPDGWQPIETVKRNQSVILCSWWRHKPESPFVCEGYLDWDGVTWREQDGSPFSNDFTAPTHWCQLPAPPALGGASHD